MKCGDKFDLVGLERDRDQLWAEARAAYDADSPWWIEEAELVKAAAESQAERFDNDPWEEGIRRFLIGEHRTTLDRILETHLDKPKKDWTRSDKIRLARCLQAMGWERYRFQDGSRLVWGYRERV